MYRDIRAVVSEVSPNIFAEVSPTEDNPPTNLIWHINLIK